MKTIIELIKLPPLTSDCGDISKLLLEDSRSPARPPGKCRGGTSGGSP